MADREALKAQLDRLEAGLPGATEFLALRALTPAQAAGLAAGTHVVVPTVYGERVKLNEDGSLDEVVTNGGAHLEQMSERGWFLEMTRVDGSSYCVWFEGKVMMTEERAAPKRLAAAQKEG